MVCLSFSLVLFLSLGAGYLFIYSDAGNTFLKPYVEDYLKEQTSLLLKVDRFTLREKQVRIVCSVNRTLSLEAVSNYNLWEGSFQGIYRLKAKDFQYKNIVLRQADIKGDFRGKTDNFQIEGKGNALDSKVSYILSILAQELRNIKVNMRGVSLSEALSLAGKEPVAKGRIDVNINMPHIGEKGTKGEGVIVLDKGVFNRTLIIKKYGYLLPKESYLKSKIKMFLKGGRLAFSLNAKSNLFHIQSKEGFVNLQTKRIHTLYTADIKELRILSHNKLSGSFLLHGSADVINKKLLLKAESPSMGGKILFSLNDMMDIHLKNVALEKIWGLFGQPPYSKGVLDMHAKIDTKMLSGAYNMQIKEGIPNRSQIEKATGFRLNKHEKFTLSSEGKITQGILEAKSMIHASFAKAVLPKTVYHFKNKSLATSFDINLYDLGMLTLNKKRVKKSSVSTKGRLKFNKNLWVEGVVSGLAKKFSFHYSSKQAKVDAKVLSLEKLWQLSMLPPYVHGEVNIEASIKGREKYNGNFSLSAKHLVTNPHVMKNLFGKPLTLKFALQSSGTLKKTKVSSQTLIKSDIAEVALQHTQFDIASHILKSSYVIDIADMTKLERIIDKKLYGKMHLEGGFGQNGSTHIWGHTDSLGGKIDYTLYGKLLKLDMKEVPVSHIMHMLGMKEIILGRASGKMMQNLKTYAATADIVIDGFQIKPNKTTKIVKSIIGKDPTRIIFKSTTLHAKRKGQMTTYTLHAKGNRVSLDITQGRFNHRTKANHASFIFIYEKHKIRGKISGSSENPKIEIDPVFMLSDKIEKEIFKGLDKVIQKKMGGFLKGFRF